MGVYIKGMKIPNGCTKCAFGKGFQYCEAMPFHFCGEVEWEMDDVKPEWCPLVEVKEPHGRLIDEDYLKEHVYQCQLNGRSLHRMETVELLDCISEVPTVIEGSNE